VLFYAKSVTEVLETNDQHIIVAFFMKNSSLLHGMEATSKCLLMPTSEGQLSLGMDAECNFQERVTSQMKQTFLPHY